MNLSINMKDGVSFVFSAKFLTHRQYSTNDLSPKQQTFINMGSYGNKRLYDHIRKSLFKNKL